MYKKDKKFFNWLMFVVVLILCISYYVGQERNRHFEEEGMTLCPYKGMEMWKLQCEAKKPWYKF
jgi:hypothetical protein